jgi:PAS domain S-box-containing protein
VKHMIEQHNETRRQLDQRTDELRASEAELVKVSRASEFYRAQGISDHLLNDAALRENEAQFRQFANAMPQIVWTASPDGELDYVNLRWFEYTGITLDDMGGSGWDPIMHPEDLRQWADCWAAACRTGAEYKNEHRFRRTDDGQYRWHLGRALPVKDAAGTIIKWFGTSTDIDDQKMAAERLEIAVQQRTAELEQLTIRAEEANRLKSVFLANMSHELRTPLNGILGFAELLFDQIPGAVNPTQQDFLGEVLKSCRHLLNLINDLLDLAKIEAGKLEVHPKWISSALVIDEVLGALGAAVIEKGIVLIRDINGPSDIWTDPRVARQVLYNYLSNALKFTPPGGQVHVRMSQSADMSICLEVSDTGEGIRAEDQTLLFKRFEQLEGRSDRPQVGTGLGLALVKEMVGLQGGTVGMDSTIGKGSRFWAKWAQPAKPASEVVAAS